jgi:deoxyadenosine/deoxycytidine kinase
MEPPSHPPIIHTAAARRALLVGIVGPCGSGKSTLLAGLANYGYICRHIAQEHSYVQAMWQIIAKPDILIYLEASFPVSTLRSQLNWLEKDHSEQLRRLTHAREHADLIVNTDDLTPEEVLRKALDFLQAKVKRERLSE